MSNDKKPHQDHGLELFVAFIEAVTYKSPDERSKYFWDYVKFYSCAAMLAAVIIALSIHFGHY